MSDNFSFPGGVNTYVPALHGDLIVEYSRNPQKFPINRYINVRKVDKMKGYYVKMKNDGQARYINPQDVVWPDGNDAPVLSYGNDSFEFAQWNATRYAYVKRLGYLGVEQAAWDLLAQESRFAAMQGMTARSRRVHTTLTTSGNSPTANVLNASTSGGATWANASSTTPAIRKSVMAAMIQIQLSTLGVVTPADMYLVINPNNAKTLATSAEFIDFIKQQPGVLQAWSGSEQYSKYNIPDQLFGLNVVVDDTVYVSTGPGPSLTPTQAFSFPDNVAILVSKQQAVKPAAGGAFSTFELFAYQEFETYVHNDVYNRRYDLQVIENVDDSFLFAPNSGVLINTNS